jgi:polyvinyl alcohol dehydrogenase (cytochrome)
MKSMSEEAILGAMTNGKMVTQAGHLSPEEKAVLAAHLSSVKTGIVDWESEMQCPADMNFDPTEKKYVTGWGLDTSNSRYQPPEQAGLRAKNLPDLELVWAHAFPGVTEMRSQPVLTQDTVFVGPSASNNIYAFDLATGCLKWRYEGTAAIRSAISIGEMPGTGNPFIFYGDVGGRVHAVNAKDGSPIWTSSLSASLNERFGSYIVTGTPVLHKDRIYIPGSSFEVTMAGDPNYECCKIHGLVRAVDARTGKEIWTYHTTSEATPQGKSSNGTQLWGPSGAPVWTTPAIDENRNVLYIGTGENYSHPTTNTSDAIIALNLDTGKSEWVFQATENDAYNLACTAWVGGKDGPNCPEDSGPDFDFGASVIIAQDKSGNDILLAGQKSGDVWALDPDNSGKVIWNTKLSGGTPVGGIHWGMTVVGDRVFVPIADPEWSISQWEYEPLAGMAALEVSTGDLLWRHESSRGCFIKGSEIDMSTGAPTVPWPTCPQYYGNSGAALGLDDMVLAGTLNGKLQAFDPDSGHIIWEYDTKRPYDTLNGVEGHGGSLDNSGSVAIGNGHMVVQSGYSYINQMPGNVVLVFRTP